MVEQTTMRPALTALLEAGLDAGGLQTDDVLSVVLPLFREVAALHEQGLVAALSNLSSYRITESGALALVLAGGTAPKSNRDAIDKLQTPVASVLHLVGETRITHEADAPMTVEDLTMASPSQIAGQTPLARPAYMPGYQAWEHRLDHHDAASDILCLGQVLASLVCNLDFSSEDDLRLFVGHRENLFALRQRLHPVVAGVINEMTELDRHRRARDLPSLIRRLETYREQPQDLALEHVGSAAQGALPQRRQAVQAHLRDRLFDLSRRNRLLHFRPTQSSVNLTVASVPMVVDLKNIKPDRLCLGAGCFANEVITGDRIQLSRWLRFEDQPYLPGALDRLIQESRRDRVEYGFSQLSLVLAFLRWHNLKEDREERVVSPLLLLPMELTRKKGVRDQYILQADTTEAEVNPVLRHQLLQVYGISLPATVDLRTTSIAAFHAQLQAQIINSEPGVQLRLVEQPEIELIHQRARQRLEQFRRRQRTRPAAPAQGTVANPDYSYHPEDFRPLGLKLFHERVKPQALPLRDAMGARPVPRHPGIVGHEVEASTFALRERTGNPYVWDVDLTTVTLGNFNYRKMSLVRDYNVLVDTDMPNPAFDRIFSMQPRVIDSEAPTPLPLAEQWTVVQADATQSAAVTLARSGASYIIQGPPGTGKSQTITNLIADYVGRGKRVLFVCEKRAAIDVVFHRLRQQGLDELCCMIHDSQADKKAFVLNLKQTYEHWLNSEDGLQGIERQRQSLLKDIEQDVQALQRFDEAMCSAPAHLGLTLRELVGRLAELREHVAPLTPQQLEALPAFEVWQRHADLAVRLHRTLQETVGVTSLAEHVFSQLGEALVRHDRPLSRLTELTDIAETLLDRCSDVSANALPDTPPLRWRDLSLLVARARQLQGLAERGQLSLLNTSSQWSQQLHTEMSGLAVLTRQAAEAAEKTLHWREKLNSPDAQSALAQALDQEGTLWRGLMPSWWRLRKEVARRYDFSRHAVRPKLSRILKDLVTDHQAQAALLEHRAKFKDTFGATDAEEFTQRLSDLRDHSRTESALAEFQQNLLEDDGARTTVDMLAALEADINELTVALNELLRDADDLRLDDLGGIVRDLRESADNLPELLPVLQELADADAILAQSLRTVPLHPSAIEQAVARESLERVYRSERWLPRFDGTVLARHVERLQAAEHQLLSLNAQFVRAAVRQRFRLNAHRSTLPASQLDAEGKAFKKTYSAGRRELEHEFGKSMRFKSIREVASADSGRVVRDMKPIWLMSPLSVSDTLPLASDLFDVVIFDEASQIPVEEAVPALYRGPQVIIVGDEMQLPPTSFFSSARDADGDEETLALDDEDERLAVVLDADSLLNQGARNLPATLLAWHYRSRYESLIGYSNAAFYSGNLYTVPDRSVPTSGLSDIVVHDAETGLNASAAHAEALLSRAISFHLMPDAIYENRRNAGEARHIARLVRELLGRQTGLSIGIVAFSEAQQSEIEAALNTLASEDTAFAARLETEFNRELDGQFCGLFVKNLENVQGDERDIIILSICYGRGPDGRMLMNFGPINQRGGEKRLNVIFSRARQHMCVVSSIRHEAITNDHNEGAAALKQFIRYAERVSCGDVVSAQRVLEGLNPTTRKALTGATRTDSVSLQLAQALRERGYLVDEQIGQSRFRCDLGVREPQADHYAIAIMVDTSTHYANRNVFERYVSRPRILGAFGWRVVQVLSSDWLHQPQTVLDRIERALKEKEMPAGSAAATNLPPQTLSNESNDANHNQFEDRTDIHHNNELGTLAHPSRGLADVDAVSPMVPTNPFDNDNGTEPVAPGTRRFKYSEGGSNKFWHIAQEGGDVTVRFGRIGTQGQTQVKQFADQQRALREVQKLVAEKIKKGYTELLD